MPLRSSTSYEYRIVPVLSAFVAMCEISSESAKIVINSLPSRERDVGRGHAIQSCRWSDEKT